MGAKELSTAAAGVRSVMGGACAMLIVAAACAAGCGGDARLASVDGVVRLDGQPLSGGIVRFIPSAGRSATGMVGGDGRFTLGTYGKSDGALIGVHAVTVTPSSSGRRPDFDSDAVSSRPTSGIPERYTTPETSGLSFEVKPGGNYAEIDLTTE